MSLGWGIAISGLDKIAPEFQKSSGKNAVYITTPFGLPRDFSSVEMGGAKGEVYLAFLISQQEYEFFSDQGAEEFEALMESKNIDPYQLSRPSCV